MKKLLAILLTAISLFGMSGLTLAADEPAATPAATPRCAWAGAGIETAETVNAAAAPSAINVFFMASPFTRRTLGIVPPKVSYFA